MQKYKVHLFLKQYYYDTVCAEDEEDAINRISRQYESDIDNGAELHIITVRKEN